MATPENNEKKENILVQLGEKIEESTTATKKAFSDVKTRVETTLAPINEFFQGLGERIEVVRQVLGRTRDNVANSYPLPQIVGTAAAVVWAETAVHTEKFDNSGSAEWVAVGGVALISVVLGMLQRAESEATNQSEKELYQKAIDLIQDILPFAHPAVLAFVAVQLTNSYMKQIGVFDQYAASEVGVKVVTVATAYQIAKFVGGKILNQIKEGQQKQRAKTAAQNAPINVVAPVTVSPVTPQIAPVTEPVDLSQILAEYDTSWAE